MHDIKVNRALRLSKTGRYPASANAMLAHVPEAVIATIPGQQLAELIDAMWDCAQASKALAAREILAEGAIWDGQRQRLREIGR